jgi:hypothetical protein
MERNDDLATLGATRLALQAVAEHVLAAALHQATGHIGLRQAPGGFATPEFTGPAGPRIVAVDGTGLVVRDGQAERRAPLTTLRAAGELVGIAPGAPRSVYEPTTPLDLDTLLAVDPTAARRLAGWYELVEAALTDLGAQVGHSPLDTQLWPEHFDLATTIDEVNYGGSPGDAEHPAPYLYVGPWSVLPADGGFWNEPFGASLDESGSPDVTTAAAFFGEGRRRTLDPG